MTDEFIALFKQKLKEASEKREFGTFDDKWQQLGVKIVSFNLASINESFTYRIKRAYAVLKVKIPNQGID